MEYNPTIYIRKIDNKLIQIGEIYLGAKSDTITFRF